MYLVSNYAVSFFEDNIWNTPQGKAIGLSYFNERGFSEETIRFFQLGYSPNTWSAFTDAALKAGYQLNFLEKIGLSILKGDKKLASSPFSTLYIESGITAVTIRLTNLFVLIPTIPERLV